MTAGGTTGNLINSMSLQDPLSLDVSLFVPPCVLIDDAYCRQISSSVRPTFAGVINPVSKICSRLRNT